MAPEMANVIDSVWFDDIVAAGKLMDEQDIPITGRKMLSQDGVMIMDERPPVFRPFPVHGGSPRISKHRRARKQRHRRK